MGAKSFIANFIFNLENWRVIENDVFGGGVSWLFCWGVKKNLKAQGFDLTWKTQRMCFCGTLCTHTMLSWNSFHPQKLNANFCSGGFEVIKVFYELTFWGLSWVNVRHRDRLLKKIGLEVVARFLGENIGSQFMPSKQIRPSALVCCNIRFTL